ncbi:MAG TPA: efflux RND transporter periplasmic adaptor subunit, partial [Steroidobacteraceae bacterium]|nr:efflux RND transporter periplasmic adaptor subunit [Steroidobacteraceae bacterium]
MKYPSLGSLLLMAFAAAMAGCGAREEPEVLVRPVRSALVAGGATADSATYTAEIRSRYETDLSFQVAGKLVNRAVDVGATVKKGQLLAQLDQTDQQLGVDAARGAVPAAQSDLDRSRSEEARFRDLLERGLTTRAQYEAQHTAVRSAEAKLSQATAELRLAQQRLGYTTLRAGEDGVVTRVMVEVGTVVAAGQRALSIARPSELEAVFDVPDGRIEEVKAGSDVVISPLSGEKAAWSGRVREISPSADPITRTYQVRTTIVKPPPSLRLGMTVSVMLSRVGGAPSISLPSTAIFQKDGKPAVWIVTAGSTVELRAVTVERYDTERVYVADGIRTGERVVTAGVHRLAPG